MRVGWQPGIVLLATLPKCSRLVFGRLPLVTLFLCKNKCYLHNPCSFCKRRQKNNIYNVYPKPKRHPWKVQCFTKDAPSSGFLLQQILKAKAPRPTESTGRHRRCMDWHRKEAPPSPTKIPSRVRQEDLDFAPRYPRMLPER